MVATIYEVPEALRELRQSDVGTMLSCGRKLWLSKVDKRPRVATKKMLVGTSFHKAAENIYRTIKMGDNLDIIEAKAQAIESLQVDFSLADPADLDLDEGETVTSAVIDSGSVVLRGIDFYVHNVLPGVIGLGTPVAVEERIDFDYRGFHLHGTVDLIDGEAILRDHKFSGSYLTKAWPDSYLSQMARYAWFLQMVGAPILGIRLDMISWAKVNRKKDPCLEYHPYDLKDAGIDLDTLIRMGRESVDGALAMIEQGIFPRSGANTFGLGCGLCPYKGAVCLGATPATVSAA